MIDATETGSITASGQSIVKDCSDYNNVLVEIQGTYATGLTIFFECSMDGTYWYAVQGSSTDTASSVLSVSLTANQTKAYDIYVGAFNYFRVRAAAWASPSGRADIFIRMSVLPTDPSQAVSVQNNVSVNVMAGPTAHSSALSASPVPIGGQVKSTFDAAMADGDAVYATFTTARQLIIRENGPSELGWKTTVGGLTTTTTAAPAKAAGATSIRNYVTGIQAVNTGTTATRLLILDGSTTIWQCMLPASMTQPLR